MLKQANQSNGTVFHELVRDHQRSVFAFALHLTGNHHDAEDLAQDVFIQAHKALSSFRGDGSIKAWLMRIALNRYLAGRRKKSLTMIQPQDVFDEVPHPDDTGPDHDAQAAVIRLEVERALEELSTRERAAFTLRFHNDLAVKDIADAMGLAEGTVKSLLFRAVHKLRGCLGHLVTDLT